MDDLALKGLKIVRKIYENCMGARKLNRPDSIQSPDEVAKIITTKLTSPSPAMIARFGANELNCLVNYLGVRDNNRSIVPFIQGKSKQWWWEQSIIDLMHKGAGFFPPTEDHIEHFCELMLKDIDQLDVLGSWLATERIFENRLNKIPKVRLTLLDPYWSEVPWTKALEGQKVLVVHPFSETIERQYARRELLFKNNDTLPDFDLRTLKAVQGIAGTKTEFKDWFEALNFMKGKIDKTDYDICLIGAGAYGFPLAAHVKRMGKKAVHIGGSLQLLFGIRGQRWEANYSTDFDYASLVNEYWVKPGENERPTNASIVEGGCYW